ncbi:hemagglutinin protein [uncultured Psychroserpens sp.]|uniref:hemagglutinin protein n=1 Tax=uncultured Psychroserpens sp. TaxID=255436 RepID=UPI0026384E97|nr:hemagglutinin protein [uncultured Psychroserpens sp.]
MRNRIFYNCMLLVLSSIYINAQTIEKFSIDNGGASVSSGDIQILYTIGETNIQELSASGISISEGFINADFRILIDPIVLLQGPSLNPITNGLMNDTLRENGLLPTTSPYEDNATCNTAVLNTTGANAIVDWIWLELRAANDNQRLINARSALVQRDGDVVDFDGASSVIMQAAPTNYYVVIKHRNHLGAMSSATINLSESTTTIVDFTTSSFLTFGNNAQTILSSGNTALWAGDVNTDDNIIFSGSNNDVNAIKDYILADPSNVLYFITYASSGYLLQDIDLNNIARFSGSPNDSNIIKDNILNHPANFLNLPTFTISTTVPPKN